MNFKDYLNEAPQFGYTKFEELIQGEMIPLSEPLMKRLGYYYDDIEAYHALNIKNFHNLVKDQNTRKHLSCFTKGDHRITSLPSKPEIIAKLQGDEVISAEGDLWTFVDSNKRRWIQIKQDYPAGKKLRFMIKGIISNIPVELDNKRKFLKEYLIRIEQFLNQNYKLLNDYLKELQKYDMGYNEVVLTRYKILGVYSLKKDQLAQELCQQYDIPYLGHLNSSDIKNL
jgi:hypothetical protein